MTGSLAYRNNERAIRRGDPPEKYLRLLPHIPGQRILEIGSAEGVLALLLAKAGRDVVAVERSAERHEAAIALSSLWNVLTPPQFVCWDVAKLTHPDVLAHRGLLDAVDTLVAVRMIYYLGDALDPVFAEVARRVPNVVLCGNANRAAAWRAGQAQDTKADNYYASHEGMTALLTRHGYEIVTTVTDGDPIVVGKRTASTQETVE